MPNIYQILSAYRTLNMAEHLKVEYPHNTNIYKYIHVCTCTHAYMHILQVHVFYFYALPYLVFCSVIYIYMHTNMFIMLSFCNF